MKATTQNSGSHSSKTDKSHKKKRIYITGFGPFGDVTENPTSLLIPKFTEEVRAKYNIVSAVILEVSMEVVNYYHQEILDTDKHIDEDTVFINMGVNAKAQKVNIERYSYNVADFSIPDAHGAQPQNEKISNKYDLGQQLKTEMHLEEIQNNTPFLANNVNISYDPGRYICNYTYFTTRTTFKHSPSLFIHVPLFDVMLEDTQFDVVCEILEAIQTNQLVCSSIIDEF